MSLPTDPFAAPSSGPLVLEPTRVQDVVLAAGPRRSRYVLAAVTGSLAVGAAAVGLSLGAGEDQEVPSAAASLAPAAGAVAPLAPPAVGAPIVPPSPSPPAVSTAPVVTESPKRAAETTRSPTRSRPATREPSERERRVQAYVTRMRDQAAQLRAWEKAYTNAYERAVTGRAHSDGDGDGHGGGHGYGHGYGRHHHR